MAKFQLLGEKVKLSYGSRSSATSMNWFFCLPNQKESMLNTNVQMPGPLQCFNST